jgi:hypothetical protein
MFNCQSGFSIVLQYRAEFEVISCFINKCSIISCFIAKCLIVFFQMFYSTAPNVLLQVVSSIVLHYYTKWSIIICFSIGFKYLNKMFNYELFFPSFYSTTPKRGFRTASWRRTCAPSAATSSW